MTVKKSKATPAPDRPDLDALIAEWQPRMKLGDWTIIAKYETHLGSRGLATVWIRRKHALIQIHDPDRWEPSEFSDTVERVFLHELGHVQLGRLDLPAHGEVNIHEEQIVEAYAHALYATKYASRP